MWSRGCSANPNIFLSRLWIILCECSNLFPTQLEIVHQNSINSSYKVWLQHELWSFMVYYSSKPHRMWLYLMLTAIFTIPAVLFRYCLCSSHVSCPTKFLITQWAAPKNALLLWVSETNDSLFRDYLTVRGHVCLFSSARLERFDAIRCVKSCQPSDSACILDPTLSVSYTFISLPTFREFTKPEGRYTFLILISNALRV